MINVNKQSGVGRSGRGGSSIPPRIDRFAMPRNDSENAFLGLLQFLGYSDTGSAFLLRIAQRLADEVGMRIEAQKCGVDGSSSRACAVLYVDVELPRKNEDSPRRTISAPALSLSITKEAVTFLAISDSQVSAQLDRALRVLKAEMPMKEEPKPGYEVRMTMPKEGLEKIVLGI